MGKIIFALRKPSKWRAIRGAADEGYRMGQAAEQVLELPFLALFGEPLDAVRARYGIVPVGASH